VLRVEGGLLTGSLAISGVPWPLAFTSGCASLRANPTRCRVVTTVASAVLVGTASAVATSATGAEAGAIVAATIGGAAETR